MANPLSLLSSLALSACSVFGVRTEEEPSFTVRDRLAGPPTVEVRVYSSRVAAETDVAGDSYAARSTGFRRVAAYIFGANRARETIAMTAPVAQAGGAGASKIAMAAPVGQSKASPGTWTIRFFMPARYSLVTLPIPTDERVRLVDVPPETIAVLRFTGSTSPTTVAARQSDLMRIVSQSGWQPRGEPFAWFYDPPWTLPPLRRNEVAVDVAAAGG